MGEFAKYGGERIKIGTCEDMYYLRADQAHMVQAESGSVDPSNPEHQKHLRFRFPWPSEDGIAPGAFGDYDKSVGLYDVSVPAEVEHHSIQFVAQRGYVVSLPCPEGPKASHGLTVHRNGFSGAVRIVQQAYRNGNLALICECGGCGARYNLPTLKDAEPVIVACRSRADREDEGSPSREFWHTVADRITAGYTKDQALAS